MSSASTPLSVSLSLARAITRTRTVDDVYAAALDALEAAFDLSRAAILLFDPDGVMRFKAWRGLSDDYRLAVDGHTPWSRSSLELDSIVVTDVRFDRAIDPFWVSRQSLEAGPAMLKPGCGWLPGEWMPEEEIRRALRHLARTKEHLKLTDYGPPLGLAPLRRELRLPGPAPVEPALDVRLGERQARRHAIDHAADRHPVALAPGGVAKKRAEAIPGHGLQPRSRTTPLGEVSLSNPRSTIEPSLACPTVGQPTRDPGGPFNLRLSPTGREAT